MTDREFTYKQLTENPIQSGEFIFEFDNPSKESFLCDFRILKNNIGIYVSNYLIKIENNKTIIRIKSVSNQKKFLILKEISRINPLHEQHLDYLESPIQDFLYLLSNEQWVVEEIVPDK